MPDLNWIGFFFSVWCWIVNVSSFLPDMIIVVFSSPFNLACHPKTLQLVHITAVRTQTSSGKSADTTRIFIFLNRLHIHARANVKELPWPTKFCLEWHCLSALSKTYTIHLPAQVVSTPVIDFKVFPSHYAFLGSSLLIFNRMAPSLPHVDWLHMLLQLYYDNHHFILVFIIVSLYDTSGCKGFKLLWSL